MTPAPWLVGGVLEAEALGEGGVGGRRGLCSAGDGEEER